MAKVYEIQEAVRGEMRPGGSEAIAYDIEPGPVDEKDLHPLVLERLIRDGLAVRATKESKK
jgi:hypothetical protein